MRRGRLGDIENPGVKAIIGRVKALGKITPAEIVDSCLDLMGPMEVADTTRDELIALAEQGGELSWENGDGGAPSQRVGDMLAQIAASIEYQFG